MTGVTGNIYCGLHEFAEMGFLLHFLRPEDLFVDVGANVGSYTILASAVCRARTIAIEPDPASVQSLKRNVDINAIGDRVRVDQIALGETCGRAHLTTGRDTTNRIARQSDGETQEVSMLSLDEATAGTTPIFVKVDVEGYEPQVIAGANAVLRNPSLQVIQLEFVDTAVRERLSRFGFRRTAYNPFNRQLSVLEAHEPVKSANTIFVRDFDLCRARIEAAPRRNVFNEQI